MAPDRVKFEEILAARLEIIKPLEGGVAAFLEGHPLLLSPALIELIAARLGLGMNRILFDKN